MRDRRSWGPLALLLASGCYGSSAPPPTERDGGPLDAPIDAGPSPRLDLLFVIDTSPSMEDEQAALTIDPPRLIRALVSGDRDEDGEIDFEPPGSVHVAVITSDIGAGSAAIPGCAGNGDDAVAIIRPRTTIPGCTAEHPRVHDFARGDDPHQLAHDVSCLALVGTRGCAIEQPLEAALKALSPSRPQAWTYDGYIAPVFSDGTRGHGDGANGGLVRDDSILAIVVITDEDDASIADPELFAATSARYDGPIETPASRHPEALHPIERYVRGYSALRRDPRDLVLVVIGGARADHVSSRSCDVAAELPAVGDEIDVDLAPGTASPAYACNVPGRGIAQWSSRVVRTACELERRGAVTAVGSICDASWSSFVLDAIVAPLRAR